MSTTTATAPSLLRHKPSLPPATHRMRISLDISSATATRTGIGVYTFELARHLCTNTSHEWTLLYNSLRQAPPPDDSLTQPSIKWRRTRIPGPLLLKAWKTLDWPPIDGFCGEGFDLFHSPAGFIPPQRNGVQVTTVHDLDFLTRDPGSLPSLGAGYLRWALDHRINNLHAIICVSRLTADHLLEHYATRTTDLNSRVHIVPHGVNPALLSPPDPALAAATRRRLGLPADGYVLYIGDRAPRKNLPMLFAAYRQVRDRTPDAPPLVVAGPPARGGRLIDGTRDRFVPPQWLNELPYVSPADLPALYYGARALALPSDLEGFGLPIIDAMACGVPVVSTTAVGALGFLPPDSALTVPPGDVEAFSQALELALSGGETVRTMTARARAAAAGLTWERAATATIAVYEAAATSAAAARPRTI